MAERYRDLDLLHPDFRPVVDRFLARCVEAGIMVMVVETWRSQAAHEEDLRNGRSWVNRSKHQKTILIETDHGLTRVPASLAIDVAPYDVYQLHGADKLQWDAEDPAWQRLAEIGEALGLICGARWKMKDMAHFQASWA